MSENNGVTIKLDRRNFRIHDERNKALIEKSLTELGLGRSIIIDSDNEVIGGNGVLEAAQKLGIPVKIIDSDGTSLYAIRRTDLKYSDPKRKQLAIMDNSTSDSSSFAEELLLEDFSVEELNFLGVEIETNPEAHEDDFEVPELSEIKTDIKLGDLFEIGNHRLLCGDSTCSDTVAKLMNGEKADMVFTDPPYALFGNSTGVSGVVDDNMVRPFFKSIMKQCQKNTVQFGHIYMCCDWHSAFSIESCAREVSLKAKNMCIWDKGDGGVGAMYQQCYEIIWFFDNSPTSDKTMGKVKAGVRTVNGVPNIWRQSRVGGERLHNAQKPVEIISIPITNGSKENDIVLDLFLGSGSTMVAAHQLKRKCYGMEISPSYCAVILRRIKLLDNSLVITNITRTFDISKELSYEKKQDK